MGVYEELAWHILIVQRGTLTAALYLVKVELLELRMVKVELRTVSTLHVSQTAARKTSQICLK